MSSLIFWLSFCIVIIFLFTIQYYVALEAGLTNFSFVISLSCILLWVIGYGGSSIWILNNYSDKFDLFFTNWNIIWSLLLITNHKNVYKVIKFNASFQEYSKKINKTSVKAKDLNSIDRHKIYYLIEQNDRENINAFYVVNIISYIILLLIIISRYIGIL
jgi:hypothetical protein